MFGDVGSLTLDDVVRTRVGGAFGNQDPGHRAFMSPFATVLGWRRISEARWWSVIYIYVFARCLLVRWVVVAKGFSCVYDGRLLYVMCGCMAVVC